MSEHTPPASHSSRYNLRHRDPPPTPPTPSDRPSSSRAARAVSPRRLRSASRPPHLPVSPSIPQNPSSSTASHRTPHHRSSRRVNLSSPLPPRPSPSPSSSSRTPSRRRHSARPLHTSSTASSPAPRRVTRSMQEPAPAVTPGPVNNPVSGRTSNRRRTTIPVAGHDSNRPAENSRDVSQNPPVSRRGKTPATSRRGSRASSRGSDTPRRGTGDTSDANDHITIEHRTGATPRRQSRRIMKLVEAKDGDDDASVSERVQTTREQPDFDEWKYVDLRFECARMGLSTKGKKVELKERLLEHLRVHQDESEAQNENHSIERGIAERGREGESTTRSVEGAKVEQPQTESESTAKGRRRGRGRSRKSEKASKGAGTPRKPVAEDEAIEKSEEDDKGKEPVRRKSDHVAPDEAQEDGRIIGDGDEKMQVDVVLSSEGVDYVVNLQRDPVRTGVGNDKALPALDGKGGSEPDDKMLSISNSHSSVGLKDPAQDDAPPATGVSKDASEAVPELTTVPTVNNVGTLKIDLSEKVAEQRATPKNPAQHALKDNRLEKGIAKLANRIDSQETKCQRIALPMGNALQIVSGVEKPKSDAQKAMKDNPLEKGIAKLANPMDSQETESQPIAPPAGNAQQLVSRVQKRKSDEASGNRSVHDRSNTNNEVDGSTMGAIADKSGMIGEIDEVVCRESQDEVEADVPQTAASQGTTDAKSVMNVEEEQDNEIIANDKRDIGSAGKRDQLESTMGTGDHGNATNTDVSRDNPTTKFETGRGDEKENAPNSQDDHQKTNIAKAESPQHEALAAPLNTGDQGEHSGEFNRRTLNFPKTSQDGTACRSDGGAAAQTEKDAAIAELVPPSADKDLTDNSGVSVAADVAQVPRLAQANSNEEGVPLRDHTSRSFAHQQRSTSGTNADCRLGIELSPAPNYSATALGGSPGPMVQENVATIFSKENERGPTNNDEPAVSDDREMVTVRKSTAATPSGVGLPRQALQRRMIDQASGDDMEDVRMATQDEEIAISGDSSASRENMEIEVSGTPQKEEDHFDESPLPSPRPMPTENDSRVDSHEIPHHASQGLSCHRNEMNALNTAASATDLPVHADSFAAHSEQALPPASNLDDSTANDSPAAVLPAVGTEASSLSEDIDSSQEESASREEDSDEGSDIVIVVEEDKPEGSEIGNDLDDVSTPQNDESDEEDDVAREDNPPSDASGESEDSRSIEDDDEDEDDDEIDLEGSGDGSNQVEGVVNNDNVENSLDEVSHESRSSQGSEPIVISDEDEDDQRSPHGSSESDKACASSRRSVDSSDSQKVLDAPGVQSGESSEECDEFGDLVEVGETAFGIPEGDIHDDPLIPDYHAGVVTRPDGDTEEKVEAISRQQATAEINGTAEVQPQLNPRKKDSALNESGKNIAESSSSSLAKRKSIAQSSKNPLGEAANRGREVRNNSDTPLDFGGDPPKDIAQPTLMSRISRTRTQRLPVEGTREDLDGRTLKTDAEAGEREITSALPLPVQTGALSQTSTPQARRAPVTAGMARLDHPALSMPACDPLSQPSGQHEVTAHLPRANVPLEHRAARKRKYPWQMEGDLVEEAEEEQDRTGFVTSDANTGPRKNDAKVNETLAAFPRAKRQRLHHPNLVPIPKMPSANDTLRALRPRFEPGGMFSARGSDVNRSDEVEENFTGPYSSVLRKLAEMERKYATPQFKPFRGIVGGVAKPHGDPPQSLNNSESAFCMGSVSKGRRRPTHPPPGKISLRVTHSRPQWDLNALAAESVQRALQVAQRMGMWKSEKCPFNPTLPSQRDNPGNSSVKRPGNHLSNPRNDYDESSKRRKW